MSPFEAYKAAFILYLDSFLTQKHWQRTRILRDKMQAVKNNLNETEFLAAGQWEHDYVNKRTRGRCI